MEVEQAKQEFEIYYNEQKQHLDNIIEKGKKTNALDGTQDEWAKYLCIQVSGFLENTIKNIILNYSTANSIQQITKYITSKTKNLTNLNEDSLRQLINSFSKEWRKIFEIKIKENRVLKDSVDSLIAVRNKLAHGENQTIRYTTVEKHFENVQKIVIIVQDIFFS